MKKLFKSPIAGLPYNAGITAPNLLQQDLRIFASRSGGNAGTTDLIYTVPIDKVYYIENIFCTGNQFISDTTSGLSVVDAGGNKVWQVTSATAASPATLTTKSFRIRGGDQIKLFYHTNDVAGLLAYSISGIEQADPFTLAVPTFPL